MERLEESLFTINFLMQKCAGRSWFYWIMNCPSMKPWLRKGSRVLKKYKSKLDKQMKYSKTLLFLFMSREWLLVSCPLHRRWVILVASHGYFCPFLHFLISFVTTDDIQSNVEGSAAATTQAWVQLAKASKSAKSKSSWVSCLALQHH